MPSEMYARDQISPRKWYANNTATSEPKAGIGFGYINASFVGEELGLGLEVVDCVVLFVEFPEEEGTGGNDREVVGLGIATLQNCWARFCALESSEEHWEDTQVVSWAVKFLLWSIISGWQKPQGSWKEHTWDRSKQRLSRCCSLPPILPGKDNWSLDHLVNIAFEQMGISGQHTARWI